MSALNFYECVIYIKYSGKYITYTTIATNEKDALSNLIAKCVDHYEECMKLFELSYYYSWTCSPPVIFQTIEEFKIFITENVSIDCILVDDFKIMDINSDFVS